MAGVDYSRAQEPENLRLWREVRVSGETFSAHLHVEWWACDAAGGWWRGAGLQLCPAVTSVVMDRRCERNLQSNFCPVQSHLFNHTLQCCY